MGGEDAACAPVGGKSGVYLSVCVETVMRMVQGQHESVRACAFMCAWDYICVCVQPGQTYILVRISVLFFFWNLVMGVNLMQGEGKAWSRDRHRRDHSLQCA